MTEEHYFDSNGELHIIYLGPSEILEIPTSDAEALDLAVWEALADLEGE